AAVACRLDAGDFLQVLQIPEPLVGLPDPAPQVREEGGRRRQRREVVLFEAAPALEDQHREPGLCQAAGGDGAPEAAADDDGLGPIGGLLCWLIHHGPTEALTTPRSLWSRDR